MLRNLRRFLTSGSVIELAAAVAIALAGVELVGAITRGLIVSPIQQSADERFGSLLGHGYFAIGGRLFDWIDPLAALITFGLVIGAVGVVAHAGREFLFDDDATECPHCLSSIPTEASVCAFCTREVVSPATS